MIKMFKPFKWLRDAYREQEVLEKKLKDRMLERIKKMPEKDKDVLDRWVVKL